MRRRKPRVVLWGGRSRDIQFGTLRDRMHTLVQRYGLFIDSGYRTLRQHHDHVHVAASDHWGDSLRYAHSVVVEAGTIKPDA